MEDMKKWRKAIYSQKLRYRYEEILWGKVQEIFDLLNSIEPEAKK